jgi:hypothetical protein
VAGLGWFGQKSVNVLEKLKSRAKLKLTAFSLTSLLLQSHAPGTREVAALPSKMNNQLIELQ